MSLKISRILHAGYLFECGGAKVAFDPIFENPFSGNAFAFPAVEFDIAGIQRLDLDAVFISHYHDDHCSFESLNLLKRNTPIYMFCVHDEIFSLLTELGFTHVRPLRLGEPVQIGALRITAHQALDANVDSLFHIQAGEYHILNVVDSWMDEDTLQKLAKICWDLVLWPFQTMREIEVLSPMRFAPATKELPPEWLAQLQILNPKVVVPSSCQFQMEDWSWYNRSFFPISYQDFKKQLSDFLPEAQIVRMNPSCSFQLTLAGLTPAGALAWVHPVGPQDLDYEYHPQNPPLPSSVVAQRFPVLSAEQSRTVQEYCNTHLLQRYREIGAAADLFFNKRRHWRLCIYDHEGLPQDFYYELRDDDIQYLTAKPVKVEWQTELPAAKLLAAIDQGEALTSMYVRINDTCFSPEIEKELQDVDILQDPLVRCLFEGVFGAYQKAQLARIKKRIL